MCLPKLVIATNAQVQEILTDEMSPCLEQFSQLALWTFWAEKFFGMGTVLCIAGCLVASLASTDEMPITYPLPTVTTKNISDIAKCPLAAKLSLVKDHRPTASQQNLLPSVQMLE